MNIVGSVFFLYEYFIILGRGLTSFIKIYTINTGKV